MVGYVGSGLQLWRLLFYSFAVSHSPTIPVSRNAMWLGRLDDAQHLVQTKLCNSSNIVQLLSYRRYET